MAIIKETLPFTFDENYQKIAQKFIEKGFDAPYEGSNTAVLASVLSYIVSSLNFSTAVNVNENLLSLATRRKNVIQDARILSYEPSHKKSTKLRITLEFFRLGYFRIPKYSQFTINDFNYVYFGEDLEFNIESVGETYSIDVKEGVLLKNEDYPDILTYKIDEKFEYIDIPWDDVEDDGIECFVTYYDSFGNLADNITFSKYSFNMIDVADSNQNKFFRKDDIDTGNARIYFQLGALGKKLPNNARVYLNILRTSGIEGSYEQCYDAKPLGNIGSFCKIIKKGSLKPILLRQAQDEETTESIKANAPLFFNSSSRTVTETDYGAIVSSHSSVKKAIIWGGESESPVQPGNIYFAVEPRREESKFSSYKKVFEEDGSFKYLKEDDNSSNNFCFLNDSYNDENKLYLTPQEIVSSKFNGENLADLGIFDLINIYNLPALKNNIKNPSYINIDLAIRIKQYPFGVAKADTRKKIFDIIRKKIGESEKFNGEYIESNIVRYLDSELGIGNGIEVKPYFSFLLSKNNLVQQFIEDKDFNKLNVFYNTRYDDGGKALVVSIYLSLLSVVGDLIYFSFNKGNLPFLEGNSDTFSYSLTDKDVKTSYLTIYFKDPGFLKDNLHVSLQSFDGLTTQGGIDINLYNLKNKKIYFYANIGLEITNIKIVLPRFVSVNDDIKILGIYGKNKAEQVINHFLITQEDIQRGYIQLDDLERGKYAGIIKAQDYKVVYTCNKESNKPSADEQPDENGLKSNQILGTYTSTFESAVDLTNKQDDVFGDIDTTQLFYNYRENINGSIDVKIWIPSLAQPNDTIIIEYNNDIQEIILDAEMIMGKTFEMLLEEQKLNVKSAGYEGEEKSIQIYLSLIKRLSELTIVEDDRIVYSNSEFNNVTSYTPTTTFDREINFKENTNVIFFVNFYNKFDVRNLISNFDDARATIEIGVPEGSPLKIEYPYIVLDNPRKTGSYTFNLNVQIKRGDLLYKDFKVFCKQSSINLTIDDGPGGCYTYLDIPVDKIYDNKGQLITDNLPTISLNMIAKRDQSDSDDALNVEQILSPNLSRQDISLAENSNKLKDYEIIETVAVDASVTEESVKNMLPFNITLGEFLDTNLTNIPFIKFPVYKFTKVADNVKRELVGTYTIFNSRIPYIRLKLLNRFFVEDNQYEFMLRYPSNNIKLIRNSIFKLRSVVFDDEVDYNVVRDGLRSGGIETLDETYQQLNTVQSDRPDSLIGS